MSLNGDSPTGNAAEPTWLRLAKRTTRELESSWFGPAQAILPTMCRLIVYGYVAQLSYNADRWIVSRKMLWFPTTYFALFDIPLFAHGTLSAIIGFHVLACWAAFLGVYYRIAAPAVALTGFYLMGMNNNFGKVDHSQNALMLCLVVLAFSRAADVWSIDAWRKGWRPDQPMPRSASYRWPQQMILLIVVLMYGAAGWSKFDRNGLAWGLSDNLRNLWLSHQFAKDPPTKIGVWLADYPMLYRSMGLGALLLELGAPLALIHSRIRALVVPGLMALQFGIFLTMGVVFRAMIPVFLCLLPWEMIVAQLSVLGRSPSRNPALGK